MADSIKIADKNSIVEVEGIEFLVERSKKSSVIKPLFTNQYHEPQFSNQFPSISVQENITNEQAVYVIRAYLQGYQEGQKAGRQQFQKEIRELLGIDSNIRDLQNKVDRMRRLDID